MNEPIGCPGFMAAGVAAGIKKPGVLDLGLLYSDRPAAAAGVFTRNRVQAAPVLLSRRRIASGTARAVVVNAGNANCCSGRQGLADAEAVSAETAAGLNLPADQVLTASTGVIGAPLPVPAIMRAVPGLIGSLRPDGFETLARSIMTTDTVPKLIQRRIEVDGRPVTLVAVAKGAGMIRPDMAPMLCFVCTDAVISAAGLQAALGAAVDRSLNRITIDGDTSTNDTVILMANGASGVVIDTPAHRGRFQAMLDDALMDIARRLVRDGEGVTKLVTIEVAGAASDAAARQVADTIGHSPLVKTAFFGQDANWGRIMAAAGRAGVELDPDRVDIYFNRVQMVRYGMGCGPKAETEVTSILKQPEFTVRIDLNAGNGTATILTCDFSVEYVKINADYRS